MRIAVPLANGSELVCQATAQGQDLVLTVWGGAPHVGSVVLAEARGSLTGRGTGVTSSVLNLPGHKDEAVARLFAERAAKVMKNTVVCVCGIHFDGLSPRGIEEVMEGAERLLERTLEQIRELSGDS